MKTQQTKHTVKSPLNPKTQHTTRDDTTTEAPTPPLACSKRKREKVNNKGKPTK